MPAKKTAKKPVQVKIQQTPYYQFTFLVLKEDFSKSQEVLSKIYELVEKSKPVPAQLLKEFTGYLSSKDVLEQNLKDSKFTEILKNTLSFFKDNADYQFTDNKDFKFSDCVEHCLVQYMATDWFRKAIGKDNDIIYSIQFLYSVMKQYTSLFKKETKPLVSDYKKIVISAYICEQLGFYVSHLNDEKPLIPEYYEAGRIVIRKERKMGTALLT